MAVSRKRTESNFVLAFGKAYIAKNHAASKPTRCRVGREVPISGFGIADFVWVAWQDKHCNEEGHAVAGNNLANSNKAVISAFEMKLKDWPRGLAQATRYRFFANTSFLVLPTQQANAAYKCRQAFKAAGVGLIAFDSTKGTFRTLLRSTVSHPHSSRAHQLLLAQISSLSLITTVA